MDSFGTEPQTIAIGVARESIQTALVALFEKLMDLESLTPSEEISSKIGVTKLRIDTLIKIDNHVLAALQSLYAEWGNSPRNFGPGVLSSATESSNRQLIESLLQGL